MITNIKYFQAISGRKKNGFLDIALEGAGAGN